MMVNDRSKLFRGHEGEEYAARYLQELGYAILERNYRVAGGEIDIIARMKNILVFVEVKTRSSLRYGYPEEAVSFSKRRRIARAARCYLGVRQLPGVSFRFDIIAVSMNGDTQPFVTHIPDVELEEDIG